MVGLPAVVGLCRDRERREFLSGQLLAKGWSVEFLPQALAQDDWGAAWEGWIRFLEERAPCVFWMLDDWDSNAIIARLSNRVKAVAYAQEYHAEIERLGHFCTAVVTPSPWLSLYISYRLPQLGPRTLTWNPDQIGDNLSLRLSKSRWKRGRSLLQPSLNQLRQEPTVDWSSAVNFINSTPLWPDTASSGPARNVSRRDAGTPPWKIFLAVGGGQISGVDVFCSHLVKALRSAGHDARILGERAMSNQQALPFDLEIPVDSLGLTPEFSWRKRCQSALEFLQSQAPCIYIPNYEFEQASMIPQLPPGVKVLLIGHSDDPTHYEQMARLGPYCDGVAVVSQAIADHLLGLAPHLAARVRVIPYGVETSSGSGPRAGGPLRILYAGRLVTYQKRVADLLLIAAELKVQQVPFQLSLVGEGHLRQWLEAEIGHLNLGSEVTLVGKLSNAALLEQMSEHQVLLLPSAFEGLPVVLLEAMDRGLVPVVSQIRSGVPELLVDGGNGLLAPAGDIGSFGRQLAYLQQNPAIWRQLSKAAQETIRRGPYRREQMVQKYLQIFEDMWQQPGRLPDHRWRPPPGVRTERSPASAGRLVLDRLREWSRRLG